MRYRGVVQRQPRIGDQPEMDIREAASVRTNISLGVRLGVVTCFLINFCPNICEYPYEQELVFIIMYW